MKNNRLILWIELFIGIALTLTFLGYKESGKDIYLPNQIAWIPFVAYGLLAIGLIIELKMGYKPIIRLPMLAVFLAIGLICLSDSYGFSSLTLSLTGIPYLISLLIACIRGGQAVTQPSVHKDKILPPGILSKKDIYLQYGLWSGIILLVVLLVVILSILNITVWYSFLALPFIIPVFIIVLLKTDTLRKILYEINQNMDYEAFELKIDEVLKNNIHPETYNFLLIIKTNYLFSYNLDKALELFQTIKEPENNKYLDLYHSVLVEGLIHLGKYDEAYKTIEMMKDSLKSKFIYFYKVFCTNENIENIEAIYPTNQKNRFSNASSLYTKMKYYESRGNTLKTQELAKELIEYAPKLLFFKEEAAKNYNNR